MNPYFWRCGLIAVVGLGGWLAGGANSPPEETGKADAMKPVTAIVKEGEGDRLRALLHGDGTGEPSFIDASLRMLAAMEKAGAREMEKACGLLLDERFKLDPGFDLLRAVLDRRYKERFPERFLASGIAGWEAEAFFRDWGGRDPRAAFAAATAIPSVALRVQRVRAVFLGGMNADLDGCLELLRGIGDPDIRRRVSGELVEMAAYRHAETYRELAAEFPDSSDAIHRAAFRELARKDGAAAVAELEKVSPLFRTIAEGAILESWIETEPSAALEWARGDGIPIPRQAYSNWARKEPVVALEAALAARKEMPDARFHLRSIFDTARRTDPAAADAWLAGVADESLRARLSLGVMASVESAPTAGELDAARFALGHPDNHGELNAGSFVARIPEAGARRDFVLSLATAVQRRLIGDLLPEWHQSDPAGLAAYVESLPSARARARVFSGALGDGQIASTPEKAALRAWAAANLDAETRSRIPVLQASPEEVAP